MTKILSFLRKIDLTVSVFHLIWALLIICLSFVVDYEYLIFNLPFFAVFLLCAILTVISMVIYRYYYRDRNIKKRILIYLGWYVLLPIAANILGLLLLDSLYDYSGVFLGGLGIFVYRIIVIGVCIIALIIYIIIRLILRKRHNKGKYMNPEKAVKLKDIMNVIMSVIILAVLIFLGIVFVSNKYYDYKYIKEEEALEEFSDEMYEKLGDNNITGEAMICAIAVEMKAKGENAPGIETENGNTLRATKATQDVIDEGAKEYKAFIKEYKPNDPQESFAISDRNGILFNYEDRSAHFYFLIPCTNQRNNDKVYCNMVLKYDEDWNLIKVYFVPHELDKRDLQ